MPVPDPALLAIVQSDRSKADVRVTTPIAESAIEHGVAPLLDDVARTRDLDGDSEALVALAMRSLESGAGTQTAARALKVFSDMAVALGVEVAVFKGLAIASRWYDSPDLRPAADIDVFVNPEHLGRLGALAEAFASGPANGAVVEHMVDHGHTFEYALSVDGVDIDLHLDPMNLVVPSRQRDPSGSGPNHSPSLGGPTVRVLDLELSLIQSLIHLLRDNFADLLHINDVRLMIDEDPDWDFIATFAEAEGWTDIIRFSLGYVCDVLDVPSPLPRDLARTSRILIGLAWPERIRLRGRQSIARSQRRQSRVSFRHLRSPNGSHPSTASPCLPTAGSY